MIKPLKIAEVRQHTGRRMTVEQAAEFVSPHQPRQFTRNQARALSVHTWNNAVAELVSVYRPHPYQLAAAWATGMSWQVWEH